MNALDYVLQEGLPQPFLQMDFAGSPVITYLHKKEISGINMLSTGVFTYFYDENWQVHLLGWDLVDYDNSPTGMILHDKLGGIPTFLSKKNFLLPHHLSGKSPDAGSKERLSDFFYHHKYDGVLVPEVHQADMKYFTQLVDTYFSIGVASGNFNEEMGIEPDETIMFKRLIAPSIESIERISHLDELLQDFERNKHMNPQLKQRKVQEIYAYLETLRDYNCYDGLRSDVDTIIKQELSR